MSFLMLDDIQVPMEPDDSSSKMQFTPIGDVDRAFDGTPISDVSGYSFEVQLQTQEILRAAANEIINKIINGPMPVEVSGDFFGGAYECDIELNELTPTALGYYRVTFTVRAKL